MAVTRLLAWSIPSTLPSSPFGPCPRDGSGMTPACPQCRLCCGSLGMLSLRGAGRPRAAPSSQLSPWLRLSPSGGLVSVLPPACPPSLQTVLVCLAPTAGWSRGRVPGPPVHNGSLFAASLPARPSPALAIIPISHALSLLPGCTTDPRPSCSALVAAALLPARGHLRASRTWATAAGFPGGKQAGCAKSRCLGPVLDPRALFKLFGARGG